MQWTEGITALCGHAAYLPTPVAAHASHTSTADLQHSCGSRAQQHRSPPVQTSKPTPSGVPAGGRGRTAPCLSSTALITWNAAGGMLLHCNNRCVAKQDNSTAARSGSVVLNHLQLLAWPA